MKFTVVTRRDFLATSVGAMATLGMTRQTEAEQADLRPARTGAVYGRAGRNGIPPGTVAVPSRGEVLLLDGRTLMASHVTSQYIRAGASVLLCPDTSGDYSILYAGFSD